MGNDVASADVRIGRISIIGLSLGAVVVAAVLIVRALLGGWDLPWTQAAPPPPSVDGPLQESAPQVSLQEYLAAKQKQLDSAGWVDKPAGIAHIPISEAMAMMARPAASASLATPAASEPGAMP